MATTYPGTIDSFTNPIGSNTLDSPDHALQHTNVNGAVIALETAVGTTAGTGVLKNFAAGDLAARKNNETLGSANLAGGTITLGSDAPGDLYYRSAAGSLTRLAIGTNNQVLAVNSSTVPNWVVPSGSISLNSKTISFTRAGTTANGTVSYTGVGFKPSVIFTYSVISATQCLSIGVADSGTVNKQVERDFDGNFYSDVNLIYCSNAAGTAIIGNLASYDADGFSIAWTKNGSPTGTATCVAMCLK